MKDKVQTYGLAAVFLVLLYQSPSGLVFYWTLNNLFSLIKNVFYRINYIQSNLPKSYEKILLINTLYDFITYHFPNWQENPYLLSYFKDFEIPDIASTFQNKSRIDQYIPTSYKSEQELFDKYDITANKVSKLTKTKNL